MFDAPSEPECCRFGLPKLAGCVCYTVCTYDAACKVQVVFGAIYAESACCTKSQTLAMPPFACPWNAGRLTLVCIAGSVAALLCNTTSLIAS
jgi:hypothetical protein